MQGAPMDGATVPGTVPAAFFGRLTELLGTFLPVIAAGHVIALEY